MAYGQTFPDLSAWKETDLSEIGDKTCCGEGAATGPHRSMSDACAEPVSLPGGKPPC